eukprot:5100141-Pyramimonas_sp.AAC.1
MRPGGRAARRMRRASSSAGKLRWGRCTTGDTSLSNKRAHLSQCVTAVGPSGYTSPCGRGCGAT